MDSVIGKTSRSLSSSLRLNLSISKKKRLDLSTASINKALPKPPTLEASDAVPAGDCSPREVPDDVIYEIVKWLPLQDVLHCALMRRSLYELCRPFLYGSVNLSYSEACRSGLEYFSRRRDLARFIKSLTLRPNVGAGWSNKAEKVIDEEWIISVVEELALDGSLASLRAFYWFGRLNPPDSLWLVLRNHCPDLRYIGLRVTISVGLTELLHPQTLHFRNLKGFHLTTQILDRGFVLIPRNRSLPPGLWTMLLENSPNLEELTLDGACLSDELWQLDPVLHGRWPSLRKFAIGHISAFDSASSSLPQKVADFLDAHYYSLEDMSLIGNATYTELSIPKFLSMPNMHTWKGRLAHLTHAGPECRLRNLYLTDWFSPSAKIGDLLKNLPHLELLSVFVNFVDTVPEWDFYEQLLTGCPQLKHLEISSTSHLSLINFSAALRLVPNLQTFTVTRCRKFSNMGLTGGSLTGGAALIASQNLNLSQITIRDVSNWEHHDQLSGVYKTKRIGTFYIVGGGPGFPNQLIGREFGVNPLGQRFSRSLVHALVLPTPQ
ncbi:hypothetical protein D9758_003936 [Tetrapyrgos nigripes]|uniref:F-box domain-containing protein n=1 Tax=Tetrapyrgos nigripes TaxID=182062 RepID=A0A8H5GL61_9AGAR|nr:hypothetical protein D9758_003936 [Tetrapyrgos nigripes]